MDVERRVKIERKKMLLVHKSMMEKTTIVLFNRPDIVTLFDWKFDEDDGRMTTAAVAAEEAEVMADHQER